jgi:hypothetical protein
LASPLLAQNGRVRMVVTDPLGDAVAGASTALLDKYDKPVRTLTTNEKGEALWTDLPIGTLRFWISEAGFQTQQVSLTVPGSEDLQIVLKVGSLGVVVPVRKRRWWWPFF